MKLNIIGYGHTRCRADWGFTTAGEGFQRVYYVLGGCCRCTIAGKTVPLKPEHLYLLPLHVPYAMEHDPDDPLCVLWQHVRLQDRDTGTKMLCRPINRDAAAWHVLQAMCALSRGMLVEQLDERYDATAQQLQSLVASLFTILEFEEPIFSALDPRLSKVLRMVAEHPQTHYTVQELAQCANLERSYFSRLFCSQMRISAQNFLIAHRLEQAAQALLKDASVTEAAAIGGYAEAKAFSRAFSGQYGLSPSQYKKYHIMQP